MTGKKLLVAVAAWISTSAMAGPIHQTTVTAKVVSVEPAYVEVNRPVRVCDQSTGYVQQPNTNSTAAELIGGVVGGLAGHQIGGGSGKTAATIAGAVGGALLGGHIANSEGSTAQPVTTETCHVEDRFTREPQGYRVTYRYQGRDYTDTLSHDPGDHVTLHVTMQAE